MIITLLRSSSYSTFSICPQQYYIEWVLGVPKPSRPSMLKGTIVHKGLEVMAEVSLCLRLGRTTFEDEEFGVVGVDEATPEWAIDHAWWYHTRLSPETEVTEADRRQCHRWIKKALAFNGGQYDPRKLHVLCPERRFDLAIEEPWAKYDYTLPDGERIEGNLVLKGTIDLVTKDRSDHGMIHVIDWKTGARKDWSKEGYAKKTYEELQHDPQLLLYHYAVARLYPEMTDISMTIFYINDGGPYSFCFDESDVAKTEEMIRRRFEEIKAVEIPFLNVGKKCTTFCHFGTTPSSHDPTKTICEFIEDKVRQDGTERVTAEYGKDRTYLRYGSGGGKRDAD